jgi:hypothetical protein
VWPVRADDSDTRARAPDEAQGNSPVVLGGIPHLCAVFALVVVGFRWLFCIETTGRREFMALCPQEFELRRKIADQVAAELGQRA